MPGMREGSLNRRTDHPPHQTARRGWVHTAVMLLILGTAWAGAFWFAATVTMQPVMRAAGMTHWLTLAPDGQLQFTQDDSDTTKYIVRRAESTSRTARFLFWPLYVRHWGFWQWSGGPDGAEHLAPPTAQQVAGFCNNLDVLEGGPPSFSHAEAAVSGDKGYTQHYVYRSGLSALLATAYLVCGPLTLLIARLARRCIVTRRINRRVAAGECPWCGYRLAGIKQSRCPECGKSVYV